MSNSSFPPLPIFQSGAPASDGVLTPASGCNCDTCPFYMHNDAAADPVCSGRNDLCSFCSCSVTEASKDNTDLAGSACESCAVRCGSRPDIHLWMASIGGTVTFDDATHTSAPPPKPLPRHIPMLDSTSVDSIHARVEWPAYGINIRRVLSRKIGTAGEPYSFQTRWVEQGAHAAMGLDPKTQSAVLFGYSNDDIIERLWERRWTDKMIDKIAAMGWDLVCTPDWSVYANQPRAEHLINMKRSVQFADELAQANVPVAPAIYWFRTEDIARWVQWIDDCQPPYIFLPKHTLRHKGEWESYAVPGLRYLGQQLDAIGANTKVIVSGVSATDRVKQIAEFFGDRLHTASQNALQLAMQGQSASSDGRTKSKAHKEDLFASSLNFYEQQINDLVAQTRTVQR